jgi:hypothetical protein
VSELVRVKAKDGLALSFAFIKMGVYQKNWATNLKK